MSPQRQHHLNQRFRVYLHLNQFPKILLKTNPILVRSERNKKLIENATEAAAVRNTVLNVSSQFYDFFYMKEKRNSKIEKYSLKSI